MRVIAAGRASELFDLGDGRVLRRFKSGGDATRDAVRQALPDAVAFRLADPQVTAMERARVRRLLARETRR
jgi:hypothetical protein